MISCFNVSDPQRKQMRSVPPPPLLAFLTLFFLPIAPCFLSPSVLLPLLPCFPPSLSGCASLAAAWFQAWFCWLVSSLAAAQWEQVEEPPSPHHTHRHTHAHILTHRHTYMHANTNTHSHTQRNTHFVFFSPNCRRHQPVSMVTSMSSFWISAHV